MHTLRYAPLAFTLLLASACSPSDSDTTTTAATTSGAETGAGETAPPPVTTSDGSTSHASHASHSGDETAAGTTHDTHEHTDTTAVGTTHDTDEHTTTSDAGTTHDTHEHTSSSDPDTTAGTTGEPAPIDEYCLCMLENCHDLFHETWGEDHRQSEAMCKAAAAAVPSVGMPAMSGDSIECRLYFCMIGHDDPTACDSALGADPCQ